MRKMGRILSVIIIVLYLSILNTTVDGSSQGYKITGSGMNYPEAHSWATLGVNIDSLDLQDSWLRYYYPDIGLKLISTSIIGVLVEGDTVTITGSGTVHGNEGFTFTATIADASPVEIQSPEGAPYYSGEIKPVVRGNFIVIHEERQEDKKEEWQRLACA